MKQHATGRRVFITGGTGSVGRELVRAFSNNGDEIVFQYFSNQRVAAELAKLDGVAKLRVDLTKQIKLPRSDFDVLINSAGINPSGAIAHEVKLRDFDAAIQMNVRVPFQLCAACLPHMIANGWGRVINISSIYGLRGVDWNLPYNVSKHGLSGLTKSIAKDYASHGITCNEICPGPLNSDMMQRIAAEEGEAAGKSTEAYLEEYAQQIPAKRLGDPSEVATLALFIASPESAYLNGTSIPVDGGWIA